MRKTFWTHCNTFSLLFFTFLGISQSSAQFLYISGGNDYSMVVCQDGRIMQWGNIYTANGAQVKTSTPTPLDAPAGLKFGQADAGSGKHGLAIACDGNVYGWGSNNDIVNNQSVIKGQIGSNTVTASATPIRIPGIAGVGNLDAVYVSGSNTSSYAILSDGKLASWGDNASRQLGRVTTGSYDHLPNYVQTAAGVPLLNVKQVDAGDQTVYALDADGFVYSWGSNADFALGRNHGGTFDTYAKKVQLVDGTPLSNIISISGGDKHGVALGADGSVYTWGGAWGNNQLGSGSGNRGYAATVLAVGGAASSVLKDAVSIAAGQASTMIVLRDGRVVTFGANCLYGAGGTQVTGSGGVLGQNRITCTSSATPSFVIEENGNQLNNISLVSDGDAVTYAINTSGDVYVMGNSLNGELGLGDFVSSGRAKKLNLNLYSCGLPDPCPDPNLGPDVPICSPSELSNVKLVVQNFRTYSYKWSYRVNKNGSFSNVTVSDTSVFVPTKLGQYMVEVSVAGGGCTECEIGRDTITVDQPSVDGGTFCKETSLTFKVPAPANGTYRWWKSQTGSADSLAVRGNSQAVALSDLSPMIVDEDTVYNLYFEDMKNYSGVVGPLATAALTGAYQAPDNERNSLYFDAVSNVKIEAVWLRVINYYSDRASSITLTVYNAENGVVTSVTNSINVPVSSTPTEAFRFPMNVTIPKGTGYYIKLSATDNGNLKMPFFDNTANVSYPYYGNGELAGLITLLGSGNRTDGGNVSNSTIGILNWEISGTKSASCGRTRVSITKDCPCNAPNPLNITSSTGYNAFCNGVASSITLKAAATPETPTIAPFNYLYQWYKNEVAVTGTAGSQNSLDINSTTGVASYKLRVGHSSLKRSKCYTETNVNISLQPPISGNSILTGNDTICQGSIAKTITGSSPSGGDGIATYQWISSNSANGTYANVSGGTGIDLAPGTINSTTFFKRIVTNGGACKNDTSASVAVVTDATITNAGIVSDGGNVCIGFAPVINVTAPVPTKTNYKFQWQTSSNGTDWSNIFGATASDLNPVPAITSNTYFRRIASSIRCTTNSASKLVEVDAPVVTSSNTIGSNQIICENSTPQTLTGSTVTGGKTPATFEWISSTTGASPWTNLGSGQNLTFTSGLTATTFFKRIVTSTGACKKDTSAGSVKITVDPTLTNAGTITPVNPLVCTDNSPVINGTVAVGGTAPLSYIWQYFNGTTWVEILTSTVEGPLVTAPSINTATEYRRIAKSVACTATSATTTVKTVSGMTAGTIVATQTEICDGGIPSKIDGDNSLATGGTGSLIEYQWQQSTDGTSWLELLGAKGTSYTPGPLNGTNYFRRRATNGAGKCDTAYTSAVTITQYKKLIPGTITSKDTLVCINSSVDVLADLPTLGSPVKKYTWLIANAPDFIFRDTLANSTSPNLSLTNLTKTTRIRRLVKDDCGIDTSTNVYTVQVVPLEIPSISILTNLAQAFCNTSNLIITAKTEKSGKARKISWSYNGATFNTDSILEINATDLVNGAKVKATVETDKSLFCTAPSASSAEITLQINTVIAGNTISGSKNEVCLGSSFGLVTGSIPTGGLSPIAYKWQMSADGSTNWTDIPNVDTANYLPKNITTTQFIRRVVTSTGVCNNDISNIVRLFVDTPVTSGKISSPSPQCGLDSIKIKNLEAATGGQNGLKFTWFYSVKPLEGYSVVSTTNSDSLTVAINDLDASGLYTKFYFIRKVTSAGGQCTNQTDTLKVTICQKPVLSGPIDAGIVCTNGFAKQYLLVKIDFTPNENGVLRMNSDSTIFPKHGQFTMTGDSLFSYDPYDDFIGLDTANVFICDTTTLPLQCRTKRLYFNVRPFNLPPVVKNETFSTYRNQAITGYSITSNDTDPNRNPGKDTLYVFPSDDNLFARKTLVQPYKYIIDSVLAKPKNGTIVMSHDGSFTYEPEKDFMGKDQAVFWVCDYSSTLYCNGFYCRKDTVTFDVKPYRIFTPEGFSPNGDGNNDFFVIRSEVTLKMELKVFNRWGNLVYESKDYKNDWDGKANRGLVIGEGLPDGTYYIYVNVNDETPQEERFKYITISR